MAANSVRDHANLSDVRDEFDEWGISITEIGRHLLAGLRRSVVSYLWIILWARQPTN